VLLRRGRQVPLAEAHEKLPGKEADDWPETGLSSTACVAEDRVYYVSNRAELVCVAAQDGKTLWILDMKKDLGVSPLHASVSSPLVVGDLVFVGTGNSIDHKTHKVTNPKAPSFIAVDRKTGKPVWQDNSPGDHIVGGAWGSPAYSVVDGRAQIVFPGGDGWLYSFDPPTGKPLWKFNCKSHEKPLAAGEDPTPIQLPATPVFAGHRVIIPVGVDVDTNDKGCLWAIDARKSGDITKDGALWRIEGDAFGLSIAGPTVQDGLAYAVEMAGYLDCIEVETGKTVWRHDLLATLWGGPLVADGKIYLKTATAKSWSSRRGGRRSSWGRRTPSRTSTRDRSWSPTASFTSREEDAVRAGRKVSRERAMKSFAFILALTALPLGSASADDNWPQCAGRR